MPPDAPDRVVEPTVRVDHGLSAAPTVRVPGDERAAAGAFHDADVASPLRQDPDPASTVRVDLGAVALPARPDAPEVGAGASRTTRALEAVVPVGRPSAGEAEPSRAEVVPRSVRPGSTVDLPSGTYRVDRVLGEPSGEAEVFLVERDGERHAFKWYFPHVRPDLGVLAALKETRHPNVVAVLDYGGYGGRTYELQEFAAGGSLAEGVVPLPLRDEGRLRDVVEAVAAGLAACHGAGLVHKDVKPENLFAADAAGRRVQVADFGLAELVEHASGKHVTVQNRTAIYAAPEVYRTLATGDDAGRVVLGKEVDYYALGVTLLYLWRGGDPFDGLGEFVVMNAKAEGNVPIPEDMPIALARLVRGLLTVVPKRRWGRAELRRWLDGEHVELFEDVHVTERTYPPLDLGDVDGTGRKAVVRSPAELADVVLRDARRGVQYLYSGRIADWVRGVDEPLHADVEHLVREEFPLDDAPGQSERRDRERAALHKLSYVLDDRRPFQTHGGTRCGTLREIGAAVEAERHHYLRALQDPRDPLYLFLEARRQRAFADRLRRSARQAAANKDRSDEAAFYDIVLHLQGWDTLRLGEASFQSPADVLAAGPAERARVARDLAAGDHTKPAVWLAGVLRDDPTWSGRLARWRRLGRHNEGTLAYLLDPQAPFDADGTAVFSAAELTEEVLARLDVAAPQDRFLDPASPFVQEADFWLLHYARHTGSDGRRAGGYADVLATLLAEHEEVLGGAAVSRVRDAAVALVEGRFTPPAPSAVRRGGVYALRRVRPDHPLVRHFRSALRRAHGSVDEENKQLARAASRMAMRRNGWAAAGLGAAVVVPMVAAGFLQAFGSDALPAAVWAAGTLGMVYGLARAIARRDVTEDETAQEARFITLLVAAPVVAVVALLAAAAGVASGGLGVVGTLVALGAAVGGSVLGAYSLGHLNAAFARRWRRVDDEISALPEPRRGLLDAEEDRVIEDVTTAWRSPSPA